MALGTTASSISLVNRLKKQTTYRVMPGGEALQKQALHIIEAHEGAAELDGEVRQKFIPGVHPVDTSGQYVIP